MKPIQPSSSTAARALAVARRALFASLVATLACLTACAAPGTPAREAIATTGDRSSASEPGGSPQAASRPASAGQTRPAQRDDAATSCRARGGDWRPACLRGEPRCIRQHPDAGKPCSDGSQCLGGCLAISPNGLPGARENGFCRANDDPCGCFARIVNGVREPALCVD